MIQSHPLPRHLCPLPCGAVLNGGIDNSDGTPYSDRGSVLHHLVHFHKQVGRLEMLVVRLLHVLKMVVGAFKNSELLLRVLLSESLRSLWLCFSFDSRDEMASSKISLSSDSLNLSSDSLSRAWRSVGESSSSTLGGSPLSPNPCFSSSAFLSDWRSTPPVLLAWRDPSVGAVVFWAACSSDN